MAGWKLVPGRPLGTYCAYGSQYGRKEGEEWKDGSSNEVEVWDGPSVLGTCCSMHGVMNSAEGFAL